MNKLQFTYIIKPVRENFNETASEEEDKIVGEHFLYLKKLHEEGIVILAGRELNAEFGIVVFQAASLDKAADIMNDDPGVKNGVFSAMLYPFRVSLLSRNS